MNSSSQNIKKSNKKRRNGPKSTEGVVDTNDAMTRQNVLPPGMGRARADATTSGSGLPNGNAPRQMFGDNIVISGGQFTQAEIMINNVYNYRGDSPVFKLLQRRVAPSALHNSAQRVDPPRCHPNTRVAILDSIYDWIRRAEQREKWLLWLNGAAGAGKSAIVQSIAERCEAAAIAIASFFFFRADSARNTMAPLMATLAYQLIQAIPETAHDILLTIDGNPLIFEQSLESQLEHLLIQPLLRLPTDLQRLFVVFIDGLDECTDRNHQASLIKLLGRVSRGRTSPIVFIVASRREPHIEAAFIRRDVSGMVRTLPLDNSDIQQTAEDIRHFLVDSFMDISQTHLRRHLLPSNWPAATVVEEIVAKSSGQFIYASVVANYVSSPRGNPAHLLEIVRGIRPRDPSSQNPFAHLDALYQHIFAQVEALDTVLGVLAYILITKESLTAFIERAFLLGAGGLEVCLADLTALIVCGPDAGVHTIRFLHASLPDFLRDRTRSERYHIDVDAYLQKLLCMFLDRAPPPIPDPGARAKALGTVAQQEHFRLWAIMDLVASAPVAQADGLDFVARQEYDRVPAIEDFLSRGAKASDRLRRAFMGFSVALYEDSFNLYLVGHVIEILKAVKRLNFSDQGQVYQHGLDVFAVGFSKSWSVLRSDDRDQVRNTPDLLARIRQIRQEEV